MFGIWANRGVILNQPVHVGRRDCRHRATVWAAIVGCLAVLALSAGEAVAEQPGIDPLEASTSPESRASALRCIPFGEMDGVTRAKVDKVLSNVTLYRRLPIRVIECDPQLYLFLIRHPDVVVNIWEVLGVSQLHLQQVAPGSFQAVDTVGTRGKLEVVHAADDLHLAYGDGCYEGPLSVRPARGSFLLVLKSGYLRDTEGRCYITSRMDCFLNLEPGATELVTKVLQPVVGKIIDTNFEQSVGFVGSLSRTAALNPRGVQRLSTRLRYVRPEVREELASMALRIGREDGESEPRLGMSEPKTSDR